MKYADRGVSNISVHLYLAHLCPFLSVVSKGHRVANDIKVGKMNTHPIYIKDLTSVLMFNEYIKRVEEKR